MKRNESVINIPPHWRGIGVGVFCLCGTTVCTYIFWETGKAIREFGVGFLLSLYCLIDSCVHYTISPEYLVVKFMGIPFRRIRWFRISGATYLTEVRKNGGRARYHSVLLTLNPTQPFYGTTQQELHAFLLRRKFKCFDILIPTGEDTVILEALKQYLEAPIITR